MQEGQEVGDPRWEVREDFLEEVLGARREGSQGWKE